MARRGRGRESICDMLKKRLPFRDIRKIRSGWAPSRRGGQIFVVPVKELHQMRLSWLLPWQVARWRSKPTLYVKFMLEQEGEGSLSAALAAAGLSQQLSVSCFDYHGVASTLEVSMNLAEMDDASIMEAGALTFGYLSMLRSGVRSWILEEIQELQELNFNFPHEMSSMSSAPFDLAQDLACNAQYFPAEEVLAADHLLYERDVQASQEILDSMTVEKARLTLVSKCFEGLCTSTEPWYGGRYLKCDSMGCEWKARWSKADGGGFGFPERNRFIPRDFTLRSVQEELPQEMNVLLANCRVWFKQTRVNQPKAAAAFCIYSSEMSSPKQVALAHLYCRLARQRLKAEAFQLRMAGAMYQLEVAESGRGGIVLQLLGFRDTLPALAKAVSSTLSSLTCRSWRHLRDQQAGEHRLGLENARSGA